MPANKNALIRYKTIDICLRKRYKKWTLEDLLDACSDALEEYEGIRKGVSLRTIQGDIQMMRSDKLGYNAPIEVYDHKYYRYADSDYSIMNMPISQNDYQVLQEAVDLLQQLQDFEQFTEISDVVSRLQDKLAIAKNDRKSIIFFDSVPELKGLKLLSPIYNYIAHRQTLVVQYKSFSATHYDEFVFYPYILKEFRNRWFLYGSKAPSMTLFNLPLDRIVSVEPIDEPYRDNPRFDAVHFFDDLVGVSKSLNSHPRKVTFWANAEQSNYIKTKPIHHSQKVIEENPEDGSCVFRIVVVLNFELYSVFMSYGPGVRVLSPPTAVEYMRDNLTLAARQYRDK